MSKTQAQLTKSQLTQARIFEACQSILVEKGSKGLTLDAVAQKAKLSKGGLLYHFPTKEVLVKELFQHVIDAFDAEINLQAESSKDEKGSWLKAYAAGSMKQALNPAISKLMASLFASVDDFPWVHNFMQEKYSDWQKKAEASGVDPAVATLFRLTIDGMWFTEIYQYAPPNTKRREEILALLNQLTFSSKSV